MAFAANNTTAGQYLPAHVAPGISVNVQSLHPTTGSRGTKVSLKVTCPYDLLGSSMTASSPFVYVLFGSHRCTAQVTRDSRDSNGSCTYTVRAEAPQFLSTGCPSLANVPLTLVLESASGEEMARVANIGAFSYQDPHGAGVGNVAVRASDDNSPPDLASPKTRSPVQQASPPHGPHQDGQTRAKTASPASHHNTLPEDSSTNNTYGFSHGLSTANAAAHVQTQGPVHSAYTSAGPGAYTHGSSNMLSSYRGASLAADPYSRPQPMLRSPHGSGWVFGSPIEAMRGSASAMPHSPHAPITRPSLTPLQPTGSATPQLVRTSTIAQPAGGYPGYGVYQEKVTLKLIGDLGAMAEGWTQEEWENKRRLVLFRKQQTGSVLTVSFKPVSAAERPPHSICISCIWWEEKKACYVTSVDTIHLLEQLLAAPNRFGVDEKNRIRRNLEGFRPATVSKARAESEEFFKVIMGFGNPKPRNIEKDVKVFHWKDLAGALYKIISKYSASTTAPMPPSPAAHVATTLGVGPAGYPALPPTPVSTPSTATTDPGATGGFVGTSGHHQHHPTQQHHHLDPVSSPRGMTGASSWPTYGGAAKPMSSAIKTSSPVSASGLRISTLPAVYDHRGTTHSLTSPYGLPGSSNDGPQHGHGPGGAGYGHSGGGVPASQAQQRNWEGYSVADAYPAQANSGGHSHVYGNGAYGDVQRA